MTSLQGFVPQYNNKIEAGDITFSISPSGLPIRVYPTVKSGNGTLGAYGNHSGPDDATYQIRISSETGNPIPTAPIFTGVGSGELQDFKVGSSVTNQKIKLICKDIGIDSEYATVNLDGLLYRFKTKGSAGNDLYITIDETNLIFTDSEKTLITELSVGDTGLEGPEFDFSTPAIEGDIIPVSSYGRIAFGEDRINIYQQYKVFENNTWVYYYIRPIQRDVRASVPIYYVTGYRIITITDGSSTSEVFSNIVTSADFYQAVKGTGIWSGASDIIEPVLTSIDLQRHIDSFAVQEIVSKTVAHFLMPYSGGSSSDYAGELVGVSVAATAPTELIEIKCISNEVLGSEIYDVTGSVSGSLGTATAGVEFLSDVVNFTVPTRFPTNYNIPEDAHEGWNYEYTSASEVSPDDSDYVLTTECVQLKLGIAAKKTTLKLEYVEIALDADGAVLSCPTIDWLEENLGLGENTELEGGDNVTDPYPIRNLVEWVDIRKKMMGQQWFDRVYDNTGSPSDNYDFCKAQGSIPMGQHWFYKITNEFFCRMKEMGYAIYNSTVDEDQSSVISLQNDLYDLVDSLEIATYPPANHNMIIWMLWDGADWSPDRPDLAQPGNIFGSCIIKYDVQLYWNMHERLWDLETTYLSKKNLPSLFAECSSESGETGSYYWKFIESPKKYLPVYSGETYYSNIYEDGEIKYTQEFGLYIEALNGAFTEGDLIEITIDQDVLEATLQVNDTTLLPLIARQNIDLAGGVDGNDRYLFEVKGENSDLVGADDYTLSRVSPQSYSYPVGALNPLISCFINERDIRFGLDDTFEVNVEGGKWQSRKQTSGIWGTWSTEYNIQKAIQEIENDINISFELGTYPSFVEGDTWTVIATQENRVSNMLTPFNYNNLNSEGSGSIVIDLGASETIDVFILGLHTITTDLLLRASDNPLFDSPYEEFTISNSETMSKVFDTPVTARYWELSTADSTQWTDISVGYLFLGDLMQLSLDADKTTPKQTWKMTSIEGKERFSLLDYRQIGFNLVFNSIQFKADYDKLITLINHVKNNGDQPFYFLPRIDNSQAYRVIIDSNSWDINMPIDLDSPDSNQLYQWTIPLIGSTD